MAHSHKQAGNGPETSSEEDICATHNKGRAMLKLQQMTKKIN